MYHFDIMYVSKICYVGYKKSIFFMFSIISHSRVLYSLSSPGANRSTIYCSVAISVRAAAEVVPSPVMLAQLMMMMIDNDVVRKTNPRFLR